MGARSVRTGSPGKSGVPFGHGEQVAGEAEAAQVIEEARRDVAKLGEPAEVVDLFAR